MNPTSIDNHPQNYEISILVVKSQKNTIKKKEINNDFSQFYIQYDFYNTLQKSSSSIYSSENNLNKYGIGTIDYILTPVAVYLDGNSYLNNTIDFDIKTLSFWFKSKDINQDTYLLSTGDNFNIQVYESNLVINNNDSFININHSFDNNIWYHLALVYNDNESKNYDIYINNNITGSNINNLITAPTTLNIGKKTLIFDNDNYNFEILVLIDNSISQRYNHSMVAIESNIYIYGGYYGTVSFNDFYKIDTSTYVVTEITLIGTDSISARYSHSMVAIESNIYIFGGYNTTGVSNDFYKIDISTNSVKKITFTGTDSISTRYSHSMVAIESNIYIFGGIDGSTYYNDFYKIDISTNSVTPIDITSISARFTHSMVAIENNIYIFGGYGDGGSLNDFYKIDTTDSYNVTKIDITGITARNTHSMVAIENNIYIFGGYNTTGELNDFYKIDLLTINQSTNSVNVKVLENTFTTSDYKKLMVTIGKDIYIFGSTISTGYNNNLIKIIGNDPYFNYSYFNGYISDLRLYSYPIITEYELTNSEFYIQYDFYNTLQKSSSSIYPFENNLNKYGIGTIDYTFTPIAVYLDGNSYLNNTIDFDIKTLSFWFKSKDINQDTYLLSTGDNFNIQVYESNLVINNNDSFININHSFDNNIWYYLALVYNDQNNYDIYIDNTNTESNINNLITAPITLNIGKKSGVFGNDNDINVELLEIYENPITSRKDHSMVAIGTDIYIFGGLDSTGPLNDFYKIDTH